MCYLWGHLATYIASFLNDLYVNINNDILSIVPRLGESVEKFISKSNKGNEETKISVVLCAPCLTDKSQGIVRNVGLIVCVGDQKCSQSGKKEQ